jgi:hypothetical protein
MLSEIRTARDIVGSGAATDLVLKAGDVVDVLDDSLSSGWWLCVNVATGKRGYAPNALLQVEREAERLNFTGLSSADIGQSGSTMVISGKCSVCANRAQWAIVSERFEAVVSNNVASSAFTKGCTTFATSSCVTVEVISCYFVVAGAECVAGAHITCQHARSDVAKTGACNHFTQASARRACARGARIDRQCCRELSAHVAAAGTARRGGRRGHATCAACDRNVRRCVGSARWPAAVG